MGGPLATLEESEFPDDVHEFIPLHVIHVSGVLILVVDAGAEITDPRDVGCTDPLEEIGMLLSAGGGVEHHAEGVQIRHLRAFAGTYYDGL